ncbi:GIY-YIG nuclease family protein [Aurantibacillus circumpalustris]|uniref:GIY-YIG nuclease family protein n=1 Tax=Aurantibacillus circumpalustris TaxID=3036359 RepID=UPI00295B252B|nr:GIY-YIG nuclease family protein [Aurantibacillus circumpalustris]
MFFAYIIVSEVKGLRFYVGMSEHPESRLNEHNSGKTTSTKGYKPWQLFFTEQFATRVLAREREKYWKSGIGKEKIKEKWQRLLDK